jgi:membrane-associated phospholipid phosphatase
MDRAKEYVIAVLASIMITVPIFAAFQAEGPWSFYGLAPTADQQQYVTVFKMLRTDQWIDLNFSHSQGLITFPSFHAILALLAAFALWPIRYVRWPAAVLACLIVISTVTTGWHYVSDVVAGILITGVACAAAKSYTRLESRMAGVGG